MFVPIARPLLGDEEIDAVTQVLRSGRLSQGERVDELERAFARLHGALHGVAVSSGTAALMAALLAHGVGAGDEVIVPSFSFFATGAAVVAVGARCVFADIDAPTYCLSVAAAEALVTPRTRAVIPVHLYGHPADMPGFEALCKSRGIALLEDAAHAHGSRGDGRSVGSWGTAAFSFHATKNMTTAEGGMVLTNDADVADRLRMIRNQGRGGRHERHELFGYNFRMSELNAALGLVQLARLPLGLERRRQNAAYLSAHLDYVRVPRVRPGCEHAYHQYTVRLSPGVERGALIERLRARGVEARVYYAPPIHRQPAFEARGDYASVNLPETERACREVLSLPVHAGLSGEELAHVARETSLACAELAQA